jgi:hypothetical protein
MKYKKFTARIKSLKKPKKAAPKQIDETPYLNKFINVIKSRIETWNLRKLTTYTISLGLLIGIITSWYWYQGIYMTPERRFWTAINNSMATPSVVRTLEDGGSGNQVTQNYRFNYRAPNFIENRVVFIEKSATTDTRIETEGIITPTEQYLRYTDFKNNTQEDLQNSDSQSVVGKWASGEENEADQEQSRLNYISEQVSLAIFGDFSSSFRYEIISKMKESSVYGTKLNEAEENTVDGKTTLQYVVDVNLREYVQLLQKSFVQLGLGEFPPLSAENYNEGSVVKARFSIDKSNNSISQIEFGGRTETYSNYGVIKSLSVPEVAFTINELQEQVQSSIQTGQ